MEKFEILKFPDPRLRTKALPVTVFDDSLQAIIETMFETMYDAGGIGLAATQVNIHQQIIVIDLTDGEHGPKVFINPSITVLDEEPHQYDEGCLSVPGFQEPILRPKVVEVSALDRMGQSFVAKYEGLMAVCIQHEMDHLSGKLFVDYLSSVKRGRIRKKLEKSKNR